MVINVMHSNGDFQLLRLFVIKSFFSNSISILGNFINSDGTNKKKNMIYIYKLFIRREEVNSS